jgi:hypothetical protein
LDRVPASKLGNNKINFRIQVCNIKIGLARGVPAMEKCEPLTRHLLKRVQDKLAIVLVGLAQQSAELV